jgi:hypothetical protein
MEDMEVEHFQGKIQPRLTDQGLMQQDGWQRILWQQVYEKSLINK